MFRKLPILLSVMILGLIVVDSFLSSEIKAGLYSLSLTIKSIIVTLLPFIIFGLLFKVMTQLTHQATKMILLILGAVCCSNFISTMLSHLVGTCVFHFDLSVIKPQGNDELQSLWTLNIPKLISNDKAMFSGIILGILFAKIAPNVANRCAKIFDKIVVKILNMILYLMPIFVAGFVVKLNYDGVIGILIKDYAVIFAGIALAQFSYILFIYFVVNRGRKSAFLQSLKNMLPAALTGFSTMSSAAAMPLTILGTEKNAKNQDLARSVIPATVNIHLIGDCFAIPILAYAILKSFNMPEPLLLDYCIFALYFVLAKFSVAAVPGGGIIVMLPILESYLAFNAPMLSLITALYILFDPVITCANVLGNGGFALVMDRCVSFFRKTASMRISAQKQSENLLRE